MTNKELQEEYQLVTLPSGLFKVYSNGLKELVKPYNYKMPVCHCFLNKLRMCDNCKERSKYDTKNTTR